MGPVSHTFICYPTFLPNHSLREVLLWVRTQVQNRIVQVINSGECGDGLGVGKWECDVVQTQPLEEDSLVTPASAEVSCPAGIIMSRWVGTSHGEASPSFYIILLTAQTQGSPQGPATDQVCH